MADKKLLVISPQQLAFGLLPDGSVVVTLNYDSAHAPWLAPGMTLTIGMTPEEARNVGQTLIRKAGEAEAGQPQGR